MPSLQDDNISTAVLGVVQEDLLPSPYRSAMFILQFFLSYLNVFDLRNLRCDFLICMSTGLDDRAIRKSQNGWFLPDAMASNFRFSDSNIGLNNVFSACKYAKNSSCNTRRPFLLYFPKGQTFF